MHIPVGKAEVHPVGLIEHTAAPGQSPSAAHAMIELLFDAKMYEMEPSALYTYDIVLSEQLARAIYL